jgi:hypothetical protein
MHEGRRRRERRSGADAGEGEIEDGAVADKMEHRVALLSFDDSRETV